MVDSNKVIQGAIKFLNNGNFSARKKYLIDARNGGAKIAGFTFCKEVWCWVIWKPTDISKNPEYKGKPLAKVVPDTVPIENIPAVLDAQPWTYV